MVLTTPPVSSSILFRESLTRISFQENELGSQNQHEVKDNSGDDLEASVTHISDSSRCDEVEKLCECGIPGHRTGRNFGS